MKENNENSYYQAKPSVINKPENRKVKEEASDNYSQAETMKINQSRLEEIEKIYINLEKIKNIKTAEARSFNEVKNKKESRSSDNFKNNANINEINSIIKNIVKEDKKYRNVEKTNIKKKSLKKQIIIAILILFIVVLVLNI